MVEYSQFKVKDLFEINKVKGVNKNKLTPPSDYSYPYITRTTYNNGILCYTGLIDDGELVSGHSFSLGLLNLDFYYQENDWYAGQFVRHIKPKYNISKHTMLYFQTLLQKLKPSLNGMVVRKMDDFILNHTWILPIDSNGKPNWQYMENYIKTLEQVH